jgi:hypothetical protein
MWFESYFLRKIKFLCKNMSVIPEYPVFFFRYLKVAAYLLPLVAIIVYLAVDSADNIERLRSCLGVLVIFVFGFAFSRYPGQVRATCNIPVSVDGSKVTPALVHEFQESAADL